MFTVRHPVSGNSSPIAQSSALGLPQLPRLLTTSMALLAAVGIARAGLAETPSPLPAMSLEQAIAYATAHQPTLTAARAQVAQGLEAQRVPRARWLPTVGANAQIFAATDSNTAAVVVASSPSVTIPRLGGTSYEPSLTIDNGASWKPYPSSYLGVGLNQLVFDFGLTAAQMASADATLLAQRHGLEGTLLDTKANVTVSFLAVQVAHEVLTAASSAVQRAAALRDQAAALVNGQLRSRIYLDRAEAELSRLRVASLRAESGLEIARSGLSLAVGFDQPLLDARDAIAPSAPLPALDAALRAAAENDPMLKSLAARIEAQRQSANAVAALARPSISLTGAVSLRSGGAPTGAASSPEFGGYLPETPNWDVGLLANWTFFDPVVFAQARAAHAQENVLRATWEATRQKLVALVQDAWESSREADQALPELQRAFDAARSNYDQANVRFTQGLGTSVEIADAETLLTDSQVQLAVGRFGLARARAELDRAMAGGL
jgi:outer membrane protein